MSGIKNRDFQFDTNSNALFEAVLGLTSIEECELFFRDILTLSELQAMTERFWVARELYEGEKSYRAINKETGVSTATITRIAQWMSNGTGGYKMALERINDRHHHTHTN